MTTDYDRGLEDAARLVYRASVAAYDTNIEMSEVLRKLAKNVIALKRGGESDGCNSHDALVEALETVIAVNDHDDPWDAANLDEYKAAMIKARAALSAAKGGA